jgi:co-chaperonin GroES (HSP10)
MRVLGNNVLVSEYKADETSAGGIILSGDIATGTKPAVVIATGNGEEVVEAALQPKDKIYLDWSKALAVELDGVKCAVVDIEHVKLIA